MDIYKLSDKVEVPNGDPGSLKITDLKQGVRNPDRLNVYINEKFSFSLDISQVVDFHLKIGREVSEEELLEFKKASEFGKLYQRALEWALTRPRSEKEVRDYLCRKLKTQSELALRAAEKEHRNHPQRKFRSPSDRALRAARPSLTLSDGHSELAPRIIERLKSRGYLDDRKFAEYYVENRFVKKGVSLKRLKMELFKKGVSKEIIEEALEKTERSDEEEIKKIIAKKRKKYDDTKLIQYLCRQGFSYDLVRELVLTSGMD